MTTRRPQLRGFLGPTASMSSPPVAIAPTPNAASVTQVPTGLTSREFGLHRVFCLAGQPRYPACLGKQGVTAPLPSAAVRTTKTIEVELPLKAGIGEQGGGVGVEFLEVVKGGNADLAGIVKGDQVVSINGVLVKWMPHKAAVEVLQSASPLTLIVSSANQPPPLPTDDTAAAGAAEARSGSGAATETAHAAAEALILDRGTGSLGLGLMAQDVTANTGLKVQTVVEGGAAHLSGGIVEGDVIASVNGVTVEKMAHGDAVQLIVQSPKVALVLATPPYHERVVLSPNFPCNAELGLRLCSAGSTGVTVVEVARGGLGAAAGFQPGDHILEVNGVPVDTEDTATVIPQLVAAGMDTVVVRRPGRTWSV